MIKNVFFDFNGTLIDDIDLTLDIENKLLVQRGLNAITKEFYLDNFCFPVINYYKKSGFDLTKINFSELNAEFMNEYTERFLKDSKLFDDVEITLKKLKENGYKVYIYSASEINLLISQLKYFGIYNYFDGIIASTNIEAHTKLDYGRDYIKEHNINVSESIMIGDTKHDFEVASAIGLKPVLYSKGHNSRKILEKIGVPVIDNLMDVFNIL